MIWERFSEGQEVPNENSVCEMLKNPTNSKGQIVAGSKTHVSQNLKRH